jgi:hypothetical protein
MSYKRLAGAWRILLALLSAAVERNSLEESEHALTYLREHREDSATLRNAAKSP